MPKFAVAHIEWSDNDLRIQIVEASNWKEAWMKHSRCGFEKIEDIPDDVEEAKQACFDMDSMMDHILIP